MDNIIGNCDNLGDNLTALGADIAGAIIPGATGLGLAARASSKASKGALIEPNRIYSARALIRRADEPGPFHNFPESYNSAIFKPGNRRVINDNYVQYELKGSINGKSGKFEIGVKPSASGRTEVITHRFFRPDL